jgi:hypothetical protein
MSIGEASLRQCLIEHVVVQLFVVAQTDRLPVALDPRRIHSAERAAAVSVIATLTKLEQVKVEARAVARPHDQLDALHTALKRREHGRHQHDHPRVICATSRPDSAVE